MKSLILLLLLAFFAYSQNYKHQPTLTKDIESPGTAQTGGYSHGSYGNGDHNQDNHKYKGNHELSDRQIE